MKGVARQDRGGEGESKRGGIGSVALRWVLTMGFDHVKVTEIGYAGRRMGNVP